MGIFSQIFGSSTVEPEIQTQALQVCKVLAQQYSDQFQQIVAKLSPEQRHNLEKHMVQ